MKSKNTANLARNVLRERERERERELPPMKTRFTHKLGAVEVTRVLEGVLELTYSGMIDVEAIRSLGWQASAATKGAGTLVFRFDGALLTMASLDVMTGTPVDSHRIVHGAIVTHEIHYEMFEAYSHRIADLGIMRAVFLADEHPQALRWAARQAWVASRAGLLRSRLDTPSS